MYARRRSILPLAVMLSSASPARHAALQAPTGCSAQTLIGRERRRHTDTTLQPTAVAADQTLRKGDQLRGGRATTC